MKSSLKQCYYHRSAISHHRFCGCFCAFAYIRAHTLHDSRGSLWI
ncbi:MAG: hypothetical protein SO164_06065 [Campylobacter sp.]|nr:hypothetical protein [Campylobacter sp.]